MGVEIAGQKQQDLFTGRFRKVKTLRSKENLEQEALFQWIVLNEKAYPGIGEAFHVPNGVTGALGRPKRSSEGG